MAQTVDDLRNEIRLAVDRYERVESTAFTKEALAALCESIGHPVESDTLPSKARMRATVGKTVDGVDIETPDEGGRAFRKAELEAIATTLRAE